MPTLQERTLAAVSQLEADADIQHEVSNGGPAVTVTTESGQVRTVANAIATLMATVPRGAWLATTVYASKDLVTQSNVVYICTIPHTAGVFATDVAAGKWAMFSGPADEGSIASGFGRQRRRGTTAQHAAFTGLAGELTVDINKKTLVVHDGLTAGGLPIARQFEINLKEFGALGDGATDDTAAIQSAFDFALASGIRRVRIPSGTYMAEGLHIKSQVEVMGEGRTHSMIKAITAASTILTLDANTYPVCLCKFALIGDAKAQYGLVAENYSLVQGRLIEFEVSGCTNGNGYGFSNSGSMLSCLMDGVYFVGNKVGAIIVGLANNILITNSFIYGNSSKNLKIGDGTTTCAMVSIINTDLEDVGGMGGDVVCCEVNNAVALSFVNCYFECNSSAGTLGISFVGAHPIQAVVRGCYAGTGGANYFCKVDAAVTELNLTFDNSFIYNFGVGTLNNLCTGDQVVSFTNDRYSGAQDTTFKGATQSIQRIYGYNGTPGSFQGQELINSSGADNDIVGIRMGVIASKSNYKKGGIVFFRTGAYGIGRLYFLSNNTEDDSNATMSDSCGFISHEGFSCPRLTTVERDAMASPPEGLMIYNLTAQKLQIRTAAAWETITSA